MNITDVAIVCHYGNKSLCEINGDYSQKEWHSAEEWQRKSSIESVAWRLDNLEAPTSAQHDSWMQQKISDGWVYGPVKDSNKRTHPDLVPYEQLNKASRAKDALFAGIVKSLAKFID